MHRVSESWPALASRGATPGREPNIPAPGLGVCVRGRKSLAQLHLRCQCATFCGPKKEDRDRSGVLTRTDLRSLIPRSRFLDPSAWRASGRGALCAPPILPFRPGRPRLAAPAVEPCGPSSPVRVLPGLPFVRPLPSGFPLRLAPSHSTLRLGWPKGPRRRSAMAGSSACASEPITLRPAVAGTPCLSLRRRGAFGGTSSLNWSGLTTKPPKRLPMKRFS